MKRKVALWLTEEEEKEVKKALQAYCLMSSKKDLIKGLLDQLQKVLNGLDCSVLPTIAYGSAYPIENDDNDWKKSFCQLQAGELGAICGIGKKQEHLKVTYDPKDQTFTLTSDGKVIMMNQNIGYVKRRFRSMFAD